MFYLLIAAYILAFANPADPTGKTMYSSGIKECDKFVFSMPPASKHPQIRLAMSVADSNGKIIEPGIYYVDISPDSGKILFKEADTLIGEFNVYKSLYLQKKVSVPSVELELNTNDCVIYMKVKYLNNESYTVLGINNQSDCH